nr:extracellular solute-binding protein [Paenibacillus baekrokdamisoli]
MKKRLLIVCICILLAATTACSAGGNGGLGSKEKPKSKDGKTVVTISLLRPDAFYLGVEKKFEKKYPDIDLQFQIFKQEGEKWGEGDFEKYIKTTNTALLSGKGADIFEMSSLPVGKYVSKKLLMNMNDWMEQDKTLNKSNLQTNILEALKVDGGLYVMPSSFYVGTFVGDGDILKKTSVKFDDKNWTWKQFEDISQQLIQKEGDSSKEHRYALANDTPEFFLLAQVKNNNTDFIDQVTQKAKFDSPLFEETMLHIKKMYDDKIMTSKPADIGNQLFYSTFLFWPEDFIDGPHRFYSNPKLLQRPHSEGEPSGTTFLTPFQLAIQDKSSVKEEAWKFISFLLSEEAQSLSEREGFSLLKSVNEKKMNEMHEKVKSGAYKLPSGKAVKISEEDFASFKQLINTADRLASTDNKVLSIIEEESKSFFSGQKTAKEVAKLIQNRVTTYLNE